MLYLIGHILLCLLLAALIGGVIGWWLRALRWNEHEEELRSSFEHEQAALQRRLDDETKALTEAESSLEQRHKELEGLRGELTTAGASLEETEATAEKRQKEIADLQSQLADSQSSLAGAEAEHQEKIGLLDASQKKLDGVQGELKKALGLVAAGKERSTDQEKQTEDLQRRLKEAESTASRDRDSAQQANQRLEQLKQQLQQADEEKLKAEEARRQAEQEAAAHRRELDGLKLNLDQTDSALAASRSRVAELEPQLEECRQARAALEAEQASKPAASPPTAAAASTAALGLISAAAGDRQARDDLKKVEGIGPKIEQLLNDDGIYTWAALSGAQIDRLQSILDQAGPRYRIHDPGTWPRQAGLAAEGKWQELEELQDRLKGGREG